MAAPQVGRDLENQRREFTVRIASALTEEEDPLSVYVQFVQWITKNYTENDPNANLTQVLKQATDTFKNDATYKSDLRYLKLWVLYTRQSDPATAINMYALLAKQHIGVSYSLLYEEYAKSLERVGRIGDAEQIYRLGIKRQVRPLERLKTTYQQFKNRNATRPSSQAPSPASAPSTSAPSSPPSTAAARYAVMMAPPAPGKRPETLKYNPSLLFTPDGVEYCSAEARARSYGLLGKKWAPLPTSSLWAAPSSSSSSRVSFNDESQRPTRTLDFGARRKSMMNGEPTVTINTKEALADVFGMYNSPEKTIKVAKPGSKYAPVRKIESLTAVKQPVNELSRSQSGGFKPYVDEPLGHKENKSNKPAKFVPFVDSDSNKTPSTSRSVLSTTFSATTTPANNSHPPPSENVFSKVFTPAAKTPLREVFTEAHGKPQAKPLTHERAKSFQDISSTPSSESNPTPTFTPFNENQRTPFKVFSRPPDDDPDTTPKASAYTPSSSAKPAFTPYRDEPPPSPPPKVSPVPSTPDERSPSPPSTASTPLTEEYEGSEVEQEDEDDYGSSFVEDEFEQTIGDTSTEESDGYAEYEEAGAYSDVPLGGRFGAFNVMTPITERTLEYTSTRSVFATPNDHPHGIDEDEEEYDSDYDNMLDREGLPEVEEDWNPNDFVQPWKHISQMEDDSTKDEPDMQELQEHTGQLSLVDALTLSSNFRPTNPCNPFDPSVMSTLLSLMPSDPHYYDLRHTDAALLDGLQKFAKKVQKANGGSSHGAPDFSSTFPLALDGHKYRVIDKLGEGGFGAVFQAQSIEARDSEDDSDSDFEDLEEDTKMVALKVVKPRNLWEYHVLRKLHSILPSAQRRSVVLPHALFAFHDESFLVLEYCAQGTLLDVVTKAVSAGVSQQGACLDELLVFFFAIEITRLLEAMHNAGFIHGDLKIDNCLLRLEDVPGGASAWASLYDPSGVDGWHFKGIKLIDFGRTINTRLFPNGQQFIADWATDARDCFEIREDRPWTHQTDYFGLAGIVYCLLFGKYIQADSVISAGGRYKVATPLKRYWQTELWTEFFELLLNPGQFGNGEMPITSELSSLRKRMEAWLQSNCNRTSGTLKGLLKKVEMSCLR
ncbi:hypothetical protein BDZ89DRAFT_1056754 [Hymenopellis radicata]|nr:hypothetical protein BDZ89DRAFT_1056754 [Hymenopellis radicata]